LLAALRRLGADSRARAIPDRRLAEECSLPPRTMIDAAAELLRAGVLVLASSTPPPGRWIGTLPEALTYRAALVRRVRHTAGRIAALDRAIAAHQRQGRLEFKDCPN
jgi:hypothetical protein